MCIDVELSEIHTCGGNNGYDSEKNDTNGSSQYARAYVKRYSSKIIGKIWIIHFMTDKCRGAK